MNDNLHKAKTAKNDEFYTLYSDIEAEVAHYEKHFAGKVVYCNCDDPAKSNFVKFFTDNRERLGLAGLLTNHLQADGSGDFRGKDALAKLEQADIVVSNPPFSLFRQYIAQLIDVSTPPILALAEPVRDKSFLIIGGKVALRLSNVFPLIKDGKIWAGVTSPTRFLTPDGKTLPVASLWITNLEHGQSMPLVLTREYDPALHLKYDNYDAVNCDKLKDIPHDYMGVIGVPITILNGYNMAQFDMIDLLSHPEINKKIFTSD